MAAHLLRRIATVPTLAIVGSLLSACGTTTILRTDAERCIDEPRDAGGVTRIDVDTPAGTRDYLLKIPENYDPRIRTPVILLFHGMRSSARAVIWSTHMATKASEAGFIVAAPSGLAQQTELGEFAGWGLEGPGYARDLSFSRAVLDDVESRTCVDEGRIYLAGFSNGSAFALKTACRSEVDVTAVAGVAAPYLGDDCVEREDEVPILYFHGTADAIVPFDGGRSVLGEIPAVATMVSRAAADRGCDAVPEVTDAGPNVVRRAWTGCDAALETYEVEGGGHRWPGSTTRSNAVVAGSGTREIEATELILEFFAGQR